MNGWQSGQSARFDSFVREKRRQQHFDGFDQRVERAYRAVVKAHKTEVINGFKRRLKSTGGKFGATEMLKMRDAVEDRTRWLREVWSQIDADYRSEDSARQAIAAKEISAALSGEPGEHMSWVYDQAQRKRFAGPKEGMEIESEMGAANLPEVSREEVNRYQNLKISMQEIEENVKSKYGLAGMQHWAELQEEKDREYAAKLDHAATIYKQLLDQSARFDESRRTALLRSHVERVHEAQVRFKASMEMEKEREAMMEAHEKMNAERLRVAKEDRLALLREAAALRAQGVPTPEIAARMKEQQLDRYARRQAEYQLAEQKRVQESQKKYRTMLAELRADVEAREGSELLNSAEGDAVSPLDARASSSTLEGGARKVADGVQQGVADAAISANRKKAVWNAVNADKYESPFLAVHQARLDAAKNYDAIYSKYFPLSLAQGKKYSRQNMGESAAGNEMDKQVFQKSNFVQEPYRWGMQSVHDLDGDGSTQYLQHLQFHVRDGRTGDIDWRYEKKKGGPVFRGPALYGIGARREAADPSEHPVDPSYLSQRQPYLKGCSRNS